MLCMTLVIDTFLVPVTLAAVANDVRSAEEPLARLVFATSGRREAWTTGWKPGCGGFWPSDASGQRFEEEGELHFGVEREPRVLRQSRVAGAVDDGEQTVA